MQVTLILYLANDKERTCRCESDDDDPVGILERLPEWIQTEDDRWVQKNRIVEVVIRDVAYEPNPLDDELHQMSDEELAARVKAGELLQGEEGPP